VEEEFPRKEFYAIGEVSRLTGVPTHMLRDWETRGKLLKPQRRRSRHRVYRFSDLQLIMEIKRLREEENLSLAAMRRQLHAPAAALPPLMNPQALAALGREVVEVLHDVRDELRELQEMLKEEEEGE